MIHPTAIIYDNVTIEDDVHIGPYCIIGAPAESIRHEGQQGKGVIIETGTKIHGAVTIDAGTERPTFIGSGCYIMKGVHIGHDARLVKDIRLAPRALIGGHVEILEGAIIGMGAIIHQRLKIPSMVIIGQGAVVIKKTSLWSNGVFVGNPAASIGFREQ